MKAILASLLLACTLSGEAFAQNMAVKNEAEGSLILHSVHASKRVGQSFNTGAMSGEITSIAVKVSDQKPWNGGLLAFDLYELNGTTLKLIGSSEIKGYFVNQVNERRFASGIQLKAHTQYAFICRNNGLNTFNLVASTGDAYKEGTAFACNTKENAPTNVNYNPENGVDLYFKVNLKVDGIIIYDAINYGGKSQMLKEGSYDIKDISAGIGNDKLASVKVPEGYEAILYGGAGFTGKVTNVSADVPDFGMYRNGISAIKVIKK